MISFFRSTYCRT